jgi:hypothetical protein
VEHETDRAADVFSTLSQRIAVERGAAYEASFWAKVEEKGAGAFSLRVVPSRGQWDAFKVKVEDGSARWRPYRVLFNPGEHGYVDLRFAAESPVKVWIDDVSVRKLRARA